MKLPFFNSVFQKNSGEHTVRREKKHRKPADRWFLLVIVLLSFFGLLMVYDASVAIAIRDFSDQYHFVYDQLRWLMMGYVILFILSYVDYRLWYKLALPILLFSLILLLAVFIPGIGIKALGAKRWLNLGLFVIQPAEVAKLALIIYLSAWFSAKEKGRLAAFLLLVGMIISLIMLEPDLGTATIILTTALVIYFLSGAPFYQFLLLIPAISAGVIGLSIFSPYRMRRILSFLNPESDPLGASYQIRQVLLALGSGGLFGVGIGKSRQKFEYLPEANTDSIFAIIGEEVGYLGAVAVISVFILLIWLGFRIAKRAPDRFGNLLGLGITSWIAIQALINLCAMVALVPLTGVPLPLISYGGSSLIITLAALGILINISRQSS